jgi:hypothetical protein
MTGSTRYMHGWRHATVLVAAATLALTISTAPGAVAAPPGDRGATPSVTAKSAAGASSPDALRAGANAVVALRAVVTLSTTRTSVGGRVTAVLNRSTVPAKHKVTIAVDWGDRTRVAVKSLAVRPAHSYVRPGRYVVHLIIRDKTKTASAAAAVLIVATPGSYAGFNGQNGNGITFFVSADGARIQDVADSGVSATCLGGGGVADHFGIASIPISPSGAFASTTIQHGIFNGQSATFTYVFRGSFDGVVAGVIHARGTWQETIALISGTTCTTNTQPWSAQRDVQPTQSQTRAPAGRYSGFNGQNGNGLTFFVSSDRTRIQDVANSGATLDCLGSGGVLDHLSIADVPVAANGSFSSTTVQTGILNGQSATFTYVFRGNFHGLSPAGVPRAAGTWRETIALGNGTTCMSDDQNWSATREAQPAQVPTSVTPGTYGGLNGQNGNGITFSVSSDSLHLLDATDTGVSLSCLGGSGAADQFAIPDIAIAPGGTFSSTTVQVGVFNAQMATFTYVFRGNFHAVNAAGIPRAAGTWRETIQLGNGTTCTSDDQNWSAVRTGA